MHRHLSRLAAAFVAAAGLVVLPASSASAEPVDTAITINLNRDLGVYFDGVGPSIAADTFAVGGRATETAGGTPLEGQTVTLFRKRPSDADFVPFATTETNADGRYRFDLRVGSTASYGARLDGDGVTYNVSYSPTAKRIDAMRDFNAGKRKVNGKLYFRGDINPGWGGRKVVLQKKACGSCTWRTVTSKNAGARGGWSFRVGYPAKVGKVWSYQAVIAPEGNFVKSYSAVLTTRRVYARGATAGVASVR